MHHNTLNTIKICRVYTPPKRKDGMWILVDKLWPRGLKKEAIAFDLWLKEIAPSTPLRQWFHEEPLMRWDAFSKKYSRELQHQAPLIQQILAMSQKAPVTLFYAAKDDQHNHALILQATLLSWPLVPENNILK